MSRNRRRNHTSSQWWGDLNAKIAASVALFAIIASVFGVGATYFFQSYSPDADENVSDELINQLLNQNQNPDANQFPIDMTPTLLDENGNPIDVEIVDPDAIPENPENPDSIPPQDVPEPPAEPTPE